MSRISDWYSFHGSRAEHRILRILDSCFSRYLNGLTCTGFVAVISSSVTLSRIFIRSDELKTSRNGISSRALRTRRLVSPASRDVLESGRKRSSSSTRRIPNSEPSVVSSPRDTFQLRAILIIVAVHFDTVSKSLDLMLSALLADLQVLKVLLSRPENAEGYWLLRRRHLAATCFYGHCCETFPLGEKQRDLSEVPASLDCPPAAWFVLLPPFHSRGGRMRLLSSTGTLDRSRPEQCPEGVFFTPNQAQRLRQLVIAKAHDCFIWFLVWSDARMRLGYVA
ncbi:hypothetical protein KC315_g48 [Hortaea werneckii]|nr:hypothetical protein KC315_g48 [Hortaea werneckii]